MYVKFARVRCTWQILKQILPDREKQPLPDAENDSNSENFTGDKEATLRK